MNEYDRKIPYTIKEEKYRNRINLYDEYIYYLFIDNRVIIDTNCFIHNLCIVKKIMKIIKIDIVIPLVVVKELKGLLRRKDRKKQAHESLQLINSLKYKENIMFQKKNGIFCIDYKNYEEEIIFNENVKKIDDIIINICKINNEILYGKNKVYLLTSDLILKIKAESNGIFVETLDIKKI
jgi:predicted ribonuclease YlaK